MFSKSHAREGRHRFSLSAGNNINNFIIRVTLGIPGFYQSVRFVINIAQGVCRFKDLEHTEAKQTDLAAYFFGGADNLLQAKNI